MGLETLHPLFVHFPIALLSVGLVFDLLYCFLKNEDFEIVASWNLFLGFFSLLPTMLTGFFSDLEYGHMESPFPIIETHGSLQILSCLLFLFLFIWKMKEKCRLPKQGKNRFVFLLIEIIAVLILFYGSHLGAVLGGLV